MDVELDVKAFRRALSGWYKLHARVLPWRETADPYRVWVSEIMLQQTRVAAVIEHYTAFMRRFPTVVSLALAEEAEVLAAWSGLGYYRRARMLHKAAQFCTREMGGVIPKSSMELRTLPGVGEYTSAAIASIAFGERIAVVDGNVERVVFRIMGRDEDTSAKGRAFVREVAGALVPSKRMLGKISGLHERTNAAGDHNQAMMELGAMICLPRGPLCLECPVYGLCRTKGEHVTAPRGKQKSEPADYLLALRKAGTLTEVLLVQRPAEASLMAGMYELPMLPIDAAGDSEPMLRLRHSITNTNYYVQVFADSRELRREMVVKEDDMHWARTNKLAELPLTGLTRKVLMRLGVMLVEMLES